MRLLVGEEEGDNGVNEFLSELDGPCVLGDFSNHHKYTDS